MGASQVLDSSAQEAARPEDTCRAVPCFNVTGTFACFHTEVVLMALTAADRPSVQPPGGHTSIICSEGSASFPGGSGYGKTLTSQGSWPRGEAGYLKRDGGVGGLCWGSPWAAGGVVGQE